MESSLPLDRCQEQQVDGWKLSGGGKEPGGFQIHSLKLSFERLQCNLHLQQTLFELESC